MSEISLPDRATIANMSPEYGATMGFFPVDHVTLQYLKLTGRSDDMPEGEMVFSSQLNLKLEDVEPCVSGPKRYDLFSVPHDQVLLKDMKADWHACLDNKVGFKGYGIPREDQRKIVKFEFEGMRAQLKHGDIVIAAITSCTNTSNPSVMIHSGLLAKKACDLGLEVKPWIKTSLGPGSKVVTKYLEKIGLLRYLKELGFHIVGYGCTTCIGNSGDLNESVASAIAENGNLVSNYLGITDHSLFRQIEDLMCEINVTPAEIAEQLLKNDYPDIVFDGLIEFFDVKRKENEEAEAKAKAKAKKKEEKELGSKRE
ncbi:hypothetical protein L2E82_33936 [Cichorium intybus]|uniref:Uncharacterized protein n=1 Tax=Cichorium intybus TaxID=13427 RepID=A0ACB9BLB7_CICIN|nr:hypothetical protein L2E82_33936 [Cichorium intybus]